MRLDRIDRVVLTVADPSRSRDALTRLGITMPPAGSSFAVGDASSAAREGNVVAVELVQGNDPSHVVAFRMDDLEPARGMFGADYEETDGTLRPRNTTAAGCGVLLLERPPACEATPHELPLKRVDHLALIPPDYEAGTRYWTDVLGVPVHAELESPTFWIRQMKVGDVMVELLRPKPGGPMADAAPGMIPVVACEVDDLAACIEDARSRGFEVPDLATGPLPGTVRATVDATQLGGLSLQLLQYV